MTSSAPQPRRVIRGVLAGTIVVGVLVLGLFAQRGHDTSHTGPQPPGGSSSPHERAGSGASASSSQEATAFLRERLPRRDPSDRMALGRSDAPVVLTQWSDFRCPYCSVFAEQTLPKLQPLVDEGTLRVEFRDLVLFGDESLKAATAARAAGAQGRYAEFSHALFKALPNRGHPEISDATVMGIVSALGLDATRFRKDWADPKLRQAALADTEEARGFGITSTPAFVVGGRFISGAQPEETFREIIRQEAEHR